MPAATQSPQSRGWNDERREKHAAAIRRWKPWAKSTGPRSAAGKARTAQNAAKPWLKRGPDYQMKQALRDHSRYLTDLNRFITLQKSAQKNELLKKYLKNYRRALLQRGRKVSAQLRHALLYAKLCKNLASEGRIPLKVNANSSIGSTLAQQAADGDGIKRTANDNG